MKQRWHNMKIHSLHIKFAVTTHGKPYPLFSEKALTIFMEIRRLLIKCAVITHWKQIHCFLKESSNNIWKSIYCLINMQWQHMKNHPLLFERGEWQLAKNRIKCLAKHQWQHLSKSIHCLLNMQGQCKENYIIAFWKKAVKICGKLLWENMQIHPLVNKYALTTKVTLNRLLF